MVKLLDSAYKFLGLQGPPGSGSDDPTAPLSNARPSESRLTTARDARQLLGALLLEDATRSLERALAKGMVDGNPPYDDERRRREGRGWECNLNFMEGEAIMDSSAVPYYNIFAGAPYYADTRTAFQPDNPDHEQWCSAIANRFHNLFKRWQYFDWHVQQCSYWMRLHGIGPAFFDRDGDWRFRALETGAVLVPKGSPSCIDKRIPYIFLRVPYRIVELWEWIKDEKAATAAGCNVVAIKNAIKYGMKGMVGVTDWYAAPWETYEHILKNNDLTTSFTDGDVVKCGIAFIQEWAKPGDNNGGKISKFIFTESHVSVGENDAASKAHVADFARDEADFLFCDPNCYEDYQEALVAFFQNTGDGSWHSVRGLAQKAFKHVEVSNRLKCQSVNRAFIDSSVTLKSTGGRSKQNRAGLSVFGTVVTLPDNAEVVPTVTQGGTEGTLAIDRMLTNHLANNIGMFQGRSMSRDDGRGEMPTATQVQQQVAKESTLSQGQITLFYQYLDALYWQAFKRAADPSTSDSEAKRFQSECLEDGVPPEALADMEYVRANRQSGYGSPQMALMKLQQSTPLVAMLPEDGKQAWLEWAVTTIHGPEFTKSFVPRLHIPNDQDWQASVENQMIAGGRTPVIAGEQDDVIHLQSHFQDAQTTLGPVAQDMQANNGHASDPQALQTALQYVQTGAPHYEEHIGRLENDPSRKKQAVMFRDQFKQLVSFSKQMFAALRSAQRQMQLEREQAQQSSSLSALDQAKVNSVQTGTALAAQKVQSQMQLQRAKAVQGMQLKDAKQAHDMLLERQSAIRSPKDLVGA